LIGSRAKFTTFRPKTIQGRFKASSESKANAGTPMAGIKLAGINWHPAPVDSRQPKNQQPQIFSSNFYRNVTIQTLEQKP